MVAIGVFFHAMFTGLAGEIDIVRQSGEAWFADISWSLRPGDLETDANQVFAHLYVCMLYVVCIGNSVRSVRPNFLFVSTFGVGARGLGRCLPLTKQTGMYTWVCASSVVWLFVGL